MIKVGDKFKDELKEWTVCEVYRGAALAFSGNITREFSKQYIYTIMYLEQKQRADELEKRWSELKQMGIETYSNLKKDKSVLAQYIRSILCVMDELEGKENVFETVQSLEDDNA